MVVWMVWAMKLSVPAGLISAVSMVWVLTAGSGALAYQVQDLVLEAPYF
jgi:hypothetical protein